jgi:flagellin-specific chaperone FliS
MKYTFDLVPEQLDEILITNLKQMYEYCIKSILHAEHRHHEDLEELFKRYDAMNVILEYYMIYKDWVKYTREWQDAITKVRDEFYANKDSKTD